MASGSRTLTAKASSAAATDVALVTGISNARIAVVAAVISSGAAASTVVFNTKPSGSGTAISGTFNMGINGGFVLPPGDFTCDWFRTNMGDGLTVTVTGTGPADVTVIYRVMY